MERQSRALAWTSILLAAVVFLLVHPILLPLVLGTWFARLARGLRDRLPVRRTFAASLVTFALVVAVALPIGLLYKFLGQGAMGLAESVSTSKGPRAAFENLVKPADDKPADLSHVGDLVKQHSEDAQSAARFGAIFAVGTVLFFFFLALSTWAVLAHGEALQAWARAHQPLRSEHFDRLSAAFTETGRGLFFYVGLTCVTQGLLCTITFLALGIPRAFVLGFVCALFAVLPVVGSPLVWIPVAIGLISIGATAKGIALLAIGGGVIAVIENIVGPLFSKLGKLRLDPALLMVGMFGGAIGLGPSGLFLGPLVVRLTKEALECARDAQLVGSTDLP